MDHRQKILSLADFLIDAGLEKEAENLVSLIKKTAQEAPTVKGWYKVLSEVDADYVDPVYNTVKNYLSAGSKQLGEAATGLRGASEEDLNELVNTIPIEKIVTAALKRDNLVKYSKNAEDLYVRSAEFCYSEGLIEKPNYKTASWWDSIKMVGSGVAKYVLPFVSFIFAAINFYYCAIEFSKLMSEVGDAGLAWYEPLMPERLLSAAKSHQDDPNASRKLARATKTSRTFVDEFISLTSNFIDGIKDAIFFFANLGSGGLTIAIDIGLSFLIMLIEFAIEGVVLPLYNKVIDLIRGNAVQKIKEHEIKAYDKLWQTEDSEESQKLDEFMSQLETQYGT